MHGGYTVLRVQLSPGRHNVRAVHAIAGDKEMVVRVVVGSHQDPTGVLQIDLVEQHLGKWLMGGEERWM